MKLFWCCFIALITTSFGFIVRIAAMDSWAMEFGFSQTQKSEIFGVGLWPFAISIIVFSLIIDRIGYKTALGLDQEKLASASDADKAVIQQASDESKKVALRDVAKLPLLMLLAYLILIFYFRSKGGYRPVELGASSH